MLDALNGQYINDSTILLLEDEPKTVEDQQSDLENSGIHCEVIDNVSEFLKFINSDYIDKIAGITLDVKLGMPPAIKDADNYDERAGCWVYREVLRPHTPNDNLRDNKVRRVVGGIPIAFLTQNGNDAKLRELSVEEGEAGRTVEKITKSANQKRRLRQWAFDAVNGFELRRSYSDSLSAASSLLELVGLKEEGIIVALGVNHFDRELMRRLRELSPDFTTSEKVLSLVPYGSTVTPSLCVAAWENIVEVVSQTIAVHSNNVTMAKEDLNLRISSLEGRSAMSIISGGNPVEVQRLIQFSRNRWNK